MRIEVTERKATVILHALDVYAANLVAWERPEEAAMVLELRKDVERQKSAAKEGLPQVQTPLLDTIERLGWEPSPQWAKDAKRDDEREEAGLKAAAVSGVAMADERETAQWYTVNSGMAEIRAIVTAEVVAKCGQYGGMPMWNKLPTERKEALRYELNRIREASAKYEAGLHAPKADHD